MELRLEHRLVMAQEQRLKMKMELAHSLALRLHHLQSEVFGEPAEVLGSVIEYVLRSAPNTAVAEVVRGIVSDPLFLREAMKHADDLALPTSDKLRQFVATHLFNASHGEFYLEDKEGEVHQLKIESIAAFREAVSDPDHVHKEIEVAKAEMARREGDVGGAQRRYQELTYSLQVAQATTEPRELIQQAITYILALRNADGESALRDFFREYILLERWNIIASVRLQKRFLASCVRIKQSTKPESFETAFINTIGEHVLVGMGVISPDLFALNRYEFDADEYRELSDDLKKSGFNLAKIMKDYSLRGPGTIFFNRWKTLGTPASQITDERIRDFITTTVRRDKENILVAAQYDEFFERLRDASAETDEDERKQAFRDCLEEKLNDERFHLALKDLIKKKWYPKLAIFYDRGLEVKPEKRAGRSETGNPF